jgi:carbonic anhydrase
MTMRMPKVIMSLFIFSAALLCAHPALAQQPPAAGAHWGYAGPDGPEHWGDLEADFSACKTGEHQSPIDIVDAQPAIIAPIHFDYKLTSLRMINNGHTIRVVYDAGSSISINGISLPLTQFHFHHLSETEINGNRYDMELHFVHEDPVSGRSAVVAVLIKSGAENPMLRVLWSHMPKDAGKEVFFKKIVINGSDLLPADQNYYTFDGSLTAPPCTENVKWYVMKTPIEASPAQIEAFSEYYPNNARPIQPTNGRTISESNFTK